MVRLMHASVGEKNQLCGFLLHCTRVQLSEESPTIPYYNDKSEGVNTDGQMWHAVGVTYLCADTCVCDGSVTVPGYILSVGSCVLVVTND